MLVIALAPVEASERGRADTAIPGVTFPVCPVEGGAFRAFTFHLFPVTGSPFSDFGLMASDRRSVLVFFPIPAKSSIFFPYRNKGET